MASESERRKQRLQREKEQREFERRRKDAIKKFGRTTTTTLPKSSKRGGWVHGGQ